MTDALKDHVENINASTATQLPVPCGYKLLIELPESEETTAGGIVLVEKTKQAEELGSIVGRVLAMGPDAYRDHDKFPTGPFCEVGDHIMMRAYSGTRFKVRGREYRMLNDDSVEAVVSNPREVTKI